MQALAQVFVSLVTVINSFAPQANLPQVLGVNDVAQYSTARETISQNLTQKKEELRQRLTQLKDERKAQTVENIDKRIETINRKWTDAWTNVLKRLSDILAKIETRSSTLAQEGKDVSTLNSSIVTAKTAINEAQSAVDTQAGKIYPITFSSEDSLRSDVQSVISQFKSDLSAVRALVAGARQAVVETFRNLKTLSEK